ncbi:MAG: fibronectin type III domain-containing protein [Gemmatimonadaceae bacterium]
MSRRVRYGLAAAGTVLLLCSTQRPVDAQSVPDGAPAIILNTAPQDREVFLTWSIQRDALYIVRWRKMRDSTWTVALPTSVNYMAVDSLDNGATYQFQLTVHTKNGDYSSVTVIEKPRVRTDCGYGVGLICTERAFLAALPKYGILTSDLRCGGEAVNLDAPLPNCRYTAGGIALSLNRSYGSVFSANDYRPSAETVTRVLNRAVWGSEDLRQVIRQDLNRVSEVNIPYGGNVKTEAVIKSYLVKIDPGIFSRVSWYSRPDHIRGRYAIYHEGHGGTAITVAADVIDWLLQHGWQVISLDMPLEGINEVDRQYPLYEHDSFAMYDRRDSSALRDFLIPLVSVTDMIEKDAVRDGVVRPTLMLMGRSGGGWSAYTYAAMDPRIDISVNIAGGSPFSTLLDSTAFSRVTPHYENHNFLYDQVTPTDIMLAAGRRAAFFFYSQNDVCCYMFTNDNEWIKYLRRLAQSDVGKRYRVFLDDAPRHGLSPRGLATLGSFLTEMGLGSEAMRPIPATTQPFPN